MSEQPPANMKICPYCGQLTSTKANFCYYCARELVARPEHPAEESKPLRINRLVVGIILAAILITIITLSIVH
jgi:predicted amidophosphoribosyltransferase